MVTADIIKAKSQGQSNLVVCSQCSVKYGNSIYNKQMRTDEVRAKYYPILDTIFNFPQ